MTMRRKFAALATTAVMAGGILALAPSAAQAAPAASETATIGPQAFCGYYSGNATVQQGSRGDAVREVQCIINYWVVSGTPLEVDGLFGPATKEWVKNFQRAMGITADGIVGPITWSYLRAI